MMQTFVAPSKTFLIGEYLALAGGPSIVLTTEPHFQLRVSASQSDLERDPFHPESPAGKLLKAHPKFKKQHHLAFLDPHHGSGGFGASSAQFALLYKAIHNLTTPDLTPDQLLQALEIYLSFSDPNTTLKPSGADVIAQLCGGISYFYSKAKLQQKLQWPFSEYDYLIFKTPYKIATHEHLAAVTLPDQPTLRILHEHAEFALAALVHQKIDDLISAIRDYQTILSRHHLTLPATQNILQELSQHPEILAAKGCGALGADVLLVIAPRHARLKVIDICQQHHLNWKTTLPILYTQDTSKCDF